MGLNQPLLDSANSVAVSGDQLAVAIEKGDGLGNGKQGKSYIAFYNLGADRVKFIKGVEVGHLPDMVAFTPDGNSLTPLPAMTSGVIPMW